MMNMNVKGKRLLCTLVSSAAISLSAAAGTGSIARASKPVPDQYIAVFVPGTTSATAVAGALLATHGGSQLAVYENTIKGFAFRASRESAEAISQSPFVEWVEEDAVVSTAAEWQPISSSPLVSGSNATLWYLDRLDQTAPSQGRFDGYYTYCHTGAGVRIYVVDTGVMPDHDEFLVSGTTSTYRVDPATALTDHLNSLGIYMGSQCWERSSSAYTASAAHGTAVASVAAGKTFGIAKSATVVDTRIFGCEGTQTASYVNAALDWIPTDPNKGAADRVVNLSFGYLTTESGTDLNTMEAIVDKLTDTYNMKVAIAAGNQNDNVYWYSPASAARGITVAGTRKDADGKWAHSNWGNTTLLYAPSQFIESAHTATKKRFPTFTRDRYRSEADLCNASSLPDTCTSGTSFAAPMVAGVIARYLQANPGASRDTIATWLQNEAATNNGIWVADPSGTSRRLLNMVDYDAYLNCVAP